MNTEKFIKELLKKYPEAEIQDICKALYQSTMGSGHFVNDISSCTERIQKEFESMESTDEDIITELDGEYVRISLSILNKGLSAQTLAHMFSLSQEEDTCASCRLERKMEDFLSLCKDEKLFTDPQTVADTVRRNYGHAGRLFVDKLSEDTDTAKTAYKRFYSLF